jgi:hypothetical protein
MVHPVIITGFEKLASEFKKQIFARSMRLTQFPKSLLCPNNHSPSILNAKLSISSLTHPHLHKVLLPGVHHLDKSADVTV